MRSKNPSTASMTMVYVFALLIFAVIGTARTYLEYKMIAHQSKAAEVINTAGRQRMLSQRIGWLTAIYDQSSPARQEALRAEVKTDAARMEKAHEVLVNGELRLSDDEPLAAEVKDMYFGKTVHLDDDMQRFQASVEDFLEAPTTAERDAARDTIDKIAMKDLVDKLDQTVALYQENADQQSRAMMQVSFYSYIALLFIIVLEALFIFRPTVKRIARQQAELMVHAHSDPLTGSFNRHTFFDMAEKALSKARTAQSPISVLVIGIDHFDTLADRHGQIFGDDILREFSAIVMPQLKSDDLFGRVAGDEFAIFMPGLDEMAAAAVAEDIRYNIAHHPITHEGKRVPVTVSIGVAGASGADTHPAAATQKAEKALFIAQHQGRDRIVRFSAAEKDLT